MDVWRVDLREVGGGPLRLLCAAERERAARIANPARRALWMRGRGMLRTLLGGYLERAPSELEFVRGEQGKLALADAGAPRGSQLQFNLSHSGPIALYAFAVGTPVGVDLELERDRARDEAALAERIFGADVARRLRRLEAPARRREFLRLWVRHEAALKCLGKGLIVGKGPIGSRGATWADSAELWIADIELGAEEAAAVAIQGGPRELRVRAWPAQAL